MFIFYLDMIKNNIFKYEDNIYNIYFIETYTNKVHIFYQKITYNNCIGKIKTLCESSGSKWFGWLGSMNKPYFYFPLFMFPFIFIVPTSHFGAQPKTIRK